MTAAHVSTVEDAARYAPAGVGRWLATHPPAPVFDTRPAGQIGGLDATAFRVSFVGGRVPAGTPVAEVAGVAVPWNSDGAVTTGAGVAVGFLATGLDLTKVSATVTRITGVLMVVRGRVVAAELPGGVIIVPAKRATPLIEYV